MNAGLPEHMEHMPEHMVERLEALNSLAGTHGTHEKPPAYSARNKSTRRKHAKKQFSYTHDVFHVFHVFLPMTNSNLKCSSKCSKKPASVPNRGTAP